MWLTLQTMSDACVPLGCSLRLVPCAGLPESALELAAQSARNDGHEGATPEAGPWQFGLDMPSLFPVLSHAKNRRAPHQQRLGMPEGLGRDRTSPCAFFHKEQTRY